jgi:hypothetical protein
MALRLVGRHGRVSITRLRGPELAWVIDWLPGGRCSPYSDPCERQIRNNERVVKPSRKVYWRCRFSWGATSHLSIVS